jgi:hypothetical protein
MTLKGHFDLRPREISADLILLGMQGNTSDTKVRSDSEGNRHSDREKKPRKISVWKSR